MRPGEVEKRVEPAGERRGEGKESEYYTCRVHQH